MLTFNLKQFTLAINLSYSNISSCTEVLKVDQVVKMSHVTCNLTVALFSLLCLGCLFYLCR